MTGKYNERNRIGKFVIKFQFYERVMRTYQSTFAPPTPKKFFKGGDLKILMMSSKIIKTLLT